jgi:hypothetical protein
MAMIQVLAAAFTIGLSLIATPAGYAACAGVGAVIGYASPRITSPLQAWHNIINARPRNTGSPDPDGKKYGQWDKLIFTAPPAQPGTASTTCDCYVTYTCRYGKGWDEICDNQRWAIDKGLNGASVYHYGERAKGKGFKQKRYGRYRATEFRSLGGYSIPDKRYRCEADEFPMGALTEAWDYQPQMVRWVNGEANGAQGRDFSAWRQAVWVPCSSFRQDVCGSAKPDPPITWKFDGMDSGRRNARADGSHFIKKYGVSLTFNNEWVRC